MELEIWYQKPEKGGVFSNLFKPCYYSAFLYDVKPSLDPDQKHEKSLIEDILVADEGKLFGFIADILLTKCAGETVYLGLYSIADTRFGPFFSKRHPFPNHIDRLVNFTLFCYNDRVSKN